MANAYQIAVELAGKVSRSFNSSVLSASNNLGQLNERAQQLETQRNRVTRFDNLQREVTETQQKFDQAQAEAARLSQEFETAKGPTRALARTLQDAEGEVQRLAHEMRNTEEPTEAMVQQLAAARDRAASVRKEFRASERQTNSLGREMERAARDARKLGTAADQQRTELDRLGAEMAEAGQSTENLTEEQERLARQLLRTQRRAEGWRRVVGADLPGAAGKFGTELGTLGRNATVAAGVVGGATTFMVHGFAESANETAQWAERLGLTVSELSRLEYVGRQYGVQQDAMIDGIKELSLRADEFAVTGVGPAEEAFSRLGLSQQKVADLSGDTAKLFDVVAEKLRGIENVAARQRIVDELFGGTGGEQMAELASASADQIERLKERADELGYTLGDKGGKSAREYTKAMREAQGALIGVRNTMALALVPALTTGMREMSQWVAENRDQIEEWGNVLQSRLGDALPHIIEAAKGIGSYLGTMAKVTAQVAELVGGYDNLALIVAGVFSAKVIASALGMVSALWQTGRGLYLLAKSGAIASAATKALAGAQWLLNAAMTANPIGLIIAGLAALAAAGYLIYENWDYLSAKASELWGTIKASVGNAVDGMVEYLMTFEPVEWMVSAWQSVMDYIEGINLFESGKAIMGTLADGILSMKDDLVAKVEGAFAEVREYLPFSDAKKGPLSQLTLSGQRIMTTLGDGVAKAGGSAIAKPMAAGMAASLSAGMAVASQGIHVPVTAYGQGGVLQDSQAALSRTIGADSLSGPASGGSQVVQLTYRPQITVQGGSSTTRQDVTQALTAGHDDLLMKLREQYEDEERLSYD